jgi:hypothetical protein
MGHHKNEAMRKEIYASLVFVVCGYAASAQLTLTPKTGIEQSFTSVGYNNQSKFSPMGAAVSPQFAVRLDYRFKNIHGPFAGIATSRSVLAYQFTDPETGFTNFTASRGDMQLRFEAGYQVSTKPITLGKAKPAARASAPAPAVKKSCGGYSAMSRCGQARKAMQPVQPAVANNEPMNLRIQPFAGMAFVPNPVTALSTANAMYTYKAGNWNTAFIAGTNFEVGKGAARKFVVGVQYLKGLGNLDNETLVTTTGTKATTTQLRSGSSAWNVTVGVPITLAKKKVAKQAAVVAPVVAPAKAPEVKKVEEKKKSCSSYYRTRCGNYQ